MAPPSPQPSALNSKPPSAQDVTTIGGVWAPTSAKRDKLTELRSALVEGQDSLDDAATADEKKDLWLADGLSLIARAADEKASEPLEEFEKWLERRSTDIPQNLDRASWDTYLESVKDELAFLSSTLPPDRILRDIRDYYELDDVDRKIIPADEHIQVLEETFDESVARFRFCLVGAAAGQLIDFWDGLVTATDADVDRAAVRGEPLQSKVLMLPLDKVNAVLRAFGSGSSSDRVEALWNLIDRDDDGLIDETEMNRAVQLSISTVQAALDELFNEAIKACPVRAPLKGTIQEEAMTTNQGWRARRRQRKIEKSLQKLFWDANNSHFQDEVEMPHRLRCIYAWAEKRHQNNKIDSVLVDSQGSSSIFGSGRKRYVELPPKISLAEFVEVQLEHFPHLNHAGEEIMKSFRENLLVDQGKKRQNQELKRDCAMFLAAVTLVDVIIHWL